MKMRILIAILGCWTFGLSGCSSSEEVGDFPPETALTGEALAMKHRDVPGRAQGARGHRYKKHAACPKPPVAPAPSSASCLFGETYREFRDSAAFEILAREIIDETRLQDLPAAQAAQLLTAVQVAYEDVVEPASALASVDQAEINRIVLREVEGSRTFVIYEYGAGDNSYGAAFEADEPERVVEIQDGDLLACTVEGQARGARVGAACGGGYGENCDLGLTCIDFDEDEGAGVCAR